MASIQVVCPIVPDELFSYESGQTRYTEQLSFVLLHNIALAAGSGVSVQYVSEEEVSSLESAFATASAQWMSFVDSVVPEAVGVDVPAIPDPADIDIYTGGGWEGLLLQLSLRVVGRLVSRYVERWLGFEEEDDQVAVDLSALQEQLELLNQNILASVDVLSSFRLSVDLEGSSKSASVGLTGVLEQV